MKKFSSFDGTSIAYLDEGDGDPVVLLHGFAADHVANWVMPGVVKALVASGRRVVAPDARGHGSSGKPHNPASYADMAMVRDAHALFDELGLDEVDLVGYSMGSMVSSHLVPEEPRVRSLILGGVGGRLLKGRPREMREGIADALEAEDASTVLDPMARAFRAFADRTGSDRKALAAVQRGTSDLSEPADFAAIKVPTLVLTGDSDTLVGDPHRLAAAIEGATVRIVKGDHLGAVGDPAFPAAVVEFVRAAAN